MLSRVASRRLPQIFLISKRNTSSINEGAVAQSKGFGKKERAHEDEYARRQEAGLLTKLRAQIEAKKQELEQLEKQHEAVEGEASKSK